MTARRTHRLAPRGRQLGLTLIELMVSIVLSMFIIIALLTLLINISRNNTEMARTNSVIENGRFALQLLEQSVGHAGYWGGYIPSFDELTLAAMPTSNSATAVVFPTALPDPCATDGPASWNDDFRARLIAIPLQVSVINGSGTPGVCASVIGSNGQPNTDILVVRHAAPCAASAAGTEADCKLANGELYFQISRCRDDAAAYRFGVHGASPVELDLRDGKCAATNPVHKYVSTVYWVRKWFSDSSDNIPTLMRTRLKVNNNAVSYETQALIDGVQGLRIQLGVDDRTKPTVSGGAGLALTAASFAAAPKFASASNTYTPTNRGDGNADTYVTCSAASAPCAEPFNLANTVAVKIYLLARAASATPSYTDSRVYCLAGSCANPTVTSCPAGGNNAAPLAGPFCDGFKRHVYTQTVRMVNLSMRREVPTTW